ncbi:MAG: phosphotransferase, partial [Deltaproteobacteria bacterium]
MHDNEVPIDAEIVGSGIAEQFPQWADLAIERVTSAGTDNAIFRLGTEMVIRLPRLATAQDQIAHDHANLPFLTNLPLAVPEPIALGKPSARFPFIWAVHRWIEAEPASPSSLPNPDQLARDLGRFVQALRHIDPNRAFGDLRSHDRGWPLSARDAPTRASI